MDRPIQLHEIHVNSSVFPGFFSCQKVSLPHFWDHVELNLHSILCLEGVILGMPPPKCGPWMPHNKEYPKPPGFDNFNLRVSFDDGFFLPSQMLKPENRPPRFSLKPGKFRINNTHHHVFFGGQPLVFGDCVFFGDSSK